MRQTRKVVLIRAMQLLVSMLVAVVAVDLIIGISRPETGEVVKLELAAVIIVSFTMVALAVAAAARYGHGAGSYSESRDGASTKLEAE
jgi:hypothetical protein